MDKLPEDILSVIFDWASERHHPESAGVDRAADAHNNPVLLSLGQVCKRWRDVALGSWERVEVYNNAEWLALVLSHSRTRLVDVRFHRVDAAEAALPLLEMYARRVRRLSLCWRSADRGRKRHWRGVNMKICQVNLPVLESLHIDNTDISPPVDGDPNAVRPAPSRHPALHTLRLARAYIPWTSAVFEQLRVLHLEKVDPPPLPSLDDFLAVLQRCTGLEELTLAYAFPVDFPDMRHARRVRAAGSSRIVVLPRLHTVNFVWGKNDGPWKNRREVRQIMQHVHLSSRTSVTIGIEHWGFSEENALWAVVHSEKDLLPILCTATAICVTSVPGEHTVFTATNDEGGSLEVTVTNRRDDAQWVYSVDEQLSNFCEIFATEKAPVRRISIATWEIEKAGVTRAFGPTLTAVEMPYAHTDLLKDLLFRLESPAKDKGRIVGPVIAPNLRRLHLGSLTWQPKLLDRIYKCLEWRAQRGTELSELYIEVYGRNVDVDDEIGNAAEILALQMQMSQPAKVTIKDIP